MILRDDQIETESEASEPKSMLGLENAGDHEIAEAPVGRILVVMRSLNVQTKEEELDLEQWENIFHTRTLVQDKVVSLIIDSGSRVNVASKLMVDKLGLSTIRHLSPYKLQWLKTLAKLR